MHTERIVFIHKKILLFVKIWMDLEGIGGVPSGSNSKESACNVGDKGSIPGLGRSPAEGNGNTFQHFCLENFMDRVA